jgi:hypothetical protein
MIEIHKKYYTNLCVVQQIASNFALNGFILKGISASRQLVSVSGWGCLKVLY